MELVALDALLTLVHPPQAQSLNAWTQAAQLAAEQAEQEGQPLSHALLPTLEGAGWQVEGSSQHTVALPQLAAMLRADPVLAAVLDRRGGVTLPQAAEALLDGWWGRCAAQAGADGPLTLLVATLSAHDHAHERPRAELYVITLPGPSWRWLARSHQVQARLQRLSLRLDEHRRAAVSLALVGRGGARQVPVRSVTLDASARWEVTPSPAPWVAY